MFLSTLYQLQRIHSTQLRERTIILFKLKGKLVLEYLKVRLLLWTSAGETEKNHEAFNPLHAELNPLCHLLTLLGAHHILHVSRIRVNESWYFCRHSDFVLYWCKSEVLPLQPTYPLLRHTCCCRCNITGRLVCLQPKILIHTGLIEITSFQDLNWRAIVWSLRPTKNFHGLHKSCHRPVHRLGFLLIAQSYGNCLCFRVKTGVVMLMDYFERDISNQLLC